MYRGIWCVGLKVNDKQEDLTAEESVTAKWILIEMSDDCGQDVSAVRQKRFADYYK